MPQGVAVLVENGLATIDFIDPTKRGPGLAALGEVTPRGLVETLTREKGAPRCRYRVPEEYARAAGLLDKAGTVDELETLEMSSAADADGFVPADDPTGANMFGPNVRSGAFADAYSGGVEFTDEQVEQIVEGVAEKLAESSGDTAAAEDSGADSTGSDPAESTEAATTTETTESGKSGGYDDGEPDTDWSRADLNAAAANAGVERPEKLPNRQAVLDAYRTAKAKAAAAQA